MVLTLCVRVKVRVMGVRVRVWVIGGVTRLSCFVRSVALAVNSDVK